MALTDDERQEILDNISKYGSTDKETAIQIPTIIYSDKMIERGGTLLNTSSGLPRFNTSTAKKFDIITTVPDVFAGMHSAHIRCCLCNQVISYPCWYYVERYVVTEKHFFVCKSLITKEDKVTTKCLAKKGWRIK